ncbi:universal stress protein [Saccharothrix algeriensis]|uniref:Nucleotide-binding universal stress UspA family protein n=1 Tax=Saccharothrix algeriensis TaxID=173560 RepID=A0A8T8I0K8_9PSEU|nr:universal stress protein [Saccharothrix algeriensis]MBM7809723.1 nucleotide-binding universal stress UspA family protein [Saccharothrix algeriensis]QTR04010.1 universal stress protein [Saccharothrix algeriensis]
MSTAAPIVVGIDGSPAGERALRWAMDEAVRRGAPLHVVNAYAYEPLADWTATTEQDARARSESLVEDALRAVAVGRSEFPRIIRRCVRGPAAEALEEQARGAAMLVVAAHGGSRFRQVLLGSTSAHCVRHATTPVVVLPATADESAVAR